MTTPTPPAKKPGPQFQVAPAPQAGAVKSDSLKHIRYAHPTTLEEFEAVYRKEYEQQLESCTGWMKWCERQTPPDTHGMNFHQGMRSAHIFNNIKMCQLLRVLKQKYPNARRGDNSESNPGHGHP